MATVVWTKTPEDALGELAEAYVLAIRAGLLTIANNRAPQIQEWMQHNHLWQNITGQAEASLAAEVFELSNDMLEIYMSQGVVWGLWLEVANAGKYGILAPALDVWSQIIWQDIKNLMR